MNSSCQWGQLCCRSDASSRGSSWWELSVGTMISREGSGRSGGVDRGAPPAEGSGQTACRAWADGLQGLGWARG